jgi:hypothetical protein
MPMASNSKEGRMVNETQYENLSLRTPDGYDGTSSRSNNRGEAPTRR